LVALEQRLPFDTSLVHYLHLHLMRTRNQIVFNLACVAFVGCASSSSQRVTSDEPSEQRWVGNMQPTQQRTGELTVTTQNRASGTVTIGMPVGIGTMQRVRVTLSVAVPQLATNQVRWAVLPNRCGSGDLPLIGFEQFPLLDIGSNGRAELQAELPLELVPNSSYHVNIYNGGQQLENVFTCGNLKFESRR
jgi:hypothetical protein